jgi:cell division ATPase FtsA
MHTRMRGLSLTPLYTQPYAASGHSNRQQKRRTSVVAVDPGAKMISPAAYRREAIRRTHAIHFAGGMHRLNRHDTMLFPGAETEAIDAI